MIITSVEAQNFKGATFNHPLSPATAIVGPNMAGKTAIVQAVRLALAGYLPECGKTPRATWELSSGPEMKVSVKFDANNWLSRKFHLDGTTVKAEVTFYEGKGSQLSREDLESLPTLNAEAYFGMTDSERTAYVFERIKLDDMFTGKAIIAECQRISFEEEHSEAVEVAKAEVIGKTSRYFEGRVAMQEGLAKAIEELREGFTYWNSRSKATQGAVTTMAELKLRETEVVAAAQGVGEQIAKAQLELGKLNAKKGQLEAQQEEAERTAIRITFLKNTCRADRTDYVRMNKKLSANIESAKSKMRGIGVLSATARKNLVAALASVTEEMVTNHHAVKQHSDIINMARSRQRELSTLETCPYCKSASEGWKKNLEWKITEEISQSKVIHDAAVANVLRQDKSIAEMESTLDTSDTAATENDTLKRSIETWEKEIKANEKAKASDDARLSEMEVELKELEQRPKNEDLTEQLDANHHDRSDMAEVINRLTLKKDAETRLKQDLRRAAEAEIEHLDAKAHVLVIKKIAGVLKDRREAMITEAFGGLLKVANTVVEGIFNQPLALHENTIGMWRKAKFIPHRVFSGTEKALTYIAVAVALSAQAPLKLVILDEFGRLDEANQTAVLLRLAGCVTNEVIDQFIVVGTSLPTLRNSAMVVPLQVIEV